MRKILHILIFFCDSFDQGMWSSEKREGKQGEKENTAKGEGRRDEMGQV